MSDSAKLFDRADIVGITWGVQTPADGRPTGLAALRRWADEIEKDGVPEATTFDPVGILRCAADEIETLRAEAVALRKAVAGLSRKAAALQRRADGTGLDVSVRDPAP